MAQIAGAIKKKRKKKKKHYHLYVTSPLLLNNLKLSTLVLPELAHNKLLTRWPTLLHRIIFKKRYLWKLIF